MEYFLNRLCYAKKPLRFKPFTGDTNVNKETLEHIEIIADKEYIIGLIDEVHRQISSIKRIGLSPLYVTMNHRTYEQMLIYNYNLTKNSTPKEMFGLNPIVTVNFKDYEVEVQCSAYDEFLYREELSKARYEVMED